MNGLSNGLNALSNGAALGSSALAMADSFNGAPPPSPPMPVNLRLLTLDWQPVFSFVGFELPEQISTGGKHNLVVHSLVGGTRIVDALGAEEEDISFKGRFRGQTAIARARFLDSLRQGGKPYRLIFSSYVRVVVFKDFKADFTQQGLEIPYDMKFLVVRNSNLVWGPPPEGVDIFLHRDLNSLQGILAWIADGNVTTAVLNLKNLAVAANGLRRGNPLQIMNAIGTAQSALGNFAAVTAPLTQGYNLAGGLIKSSLAPLGVAGALSGAQNAFAQMAQAQQGLALLGRIKTNIQSGGFI